MDKVWTKIYCHFYFRGITLILTFVAVVVLFQLTLYAISGFSLCFFFQPKGLVKVFKLLFPIQVLVVILMPVKLSCSRFTTKMDTILSNWLSIEIKNTQCITAPATDQLLVLAVGIMTSRYRTTLWATQDRIPLAAKHTPFLQDIQLVTVGFSLEAIISVLLTLKCFTK